MNLYFRTIEILIGLALSFSISCGFSEDKEPQVGLLFEGHFENPEITSDVQGAQKTKLSAAYTWTYGVRLFTLKSWKEKGISWEDFAARAGALADDIASKLKPTYERDHRGVIEYAIVGGGNPFMSSAVTSPEFLKLFSQTLGERLHVIIVDRFLIYVFPANGGKLKDFGPSLVGVFQQTPMPVSLEIFEIDRTGYRVIGEIERPSKPVEYGEETAVK